MIYQVTDIAKVDIAQILYWKFMESWNCP